MKTFKLWLEDDQNNQFQQLVKNTENVDTIGYHVSRAIFDKFDDTRLGGNTQGSYGQGHTIYSIDSLLGHQFVDNPSRLVNYQNVGLLGGYMYKVNLRLGKTAVLDIHQLRTAFPKTDPNSVPMAKQFRTWLISQGFGGVRITGGQQGKLMENTLVALSANSVRIRSIKNLKTGTEVQSKNGPLQQQINQIIQQRKAS